MSVLRTHNAGRQVGHTCSPSKPVIAINMQIRYSTQYPTCEQRANRRCPNAHSHLPFPLQVDDYSFNGCECVASAVYAAGSPICNFLRVVAVLVVGQVAGGTCMFVLERDESTLLSEASNASIEAPKLARSAPTHPPVQHPPSDLDQLYKLSVPFCSSSNASTPGW